MVPVLRTPVSSFLSPSLAKPSLLQRLFGSLNGSLTTQPPNKTNADAKKKADAGRTRVLTSADAAVVNGPAHTAMAGGASLPLPPASASYVFACVVK
jgi:hypothetical protein